MLYLYSMLYTFALPVMYPSMLSRYSLMPYYALFGVISVSMSCVSTPLGGKLCDTVGRKRLFLITGTLRLVLMFLCGIRTTPLVFSVLYLSSSCISGFMYAIPLAILSDLTTPEERPRYFGYFGAITGVSLLSGILLGGIITDLFGPFSMFFLFIPILLAAMVLIGYGYTDRAGAARVSLDAPGCLLMALCLASLVILCSFGGSAFPWISWISGGLLAGCVVFFLLFLRRERHCSDPLLDLSIFSDRNFDLSFACGFLIAPMVSLCSGYLVLFGQVALGLSSTVSSTLALPKNIIYLILPTFLGIWVSKNAGRYRLSFLGCGGLIALAGALASLWSVQTGILTIYLVMIVFGLATSCQSISMQPYMQLTVSPARIGIASSLISFSTTLGSTLIGAVNTIYFNARYSIARNVPEPLRQAMSGEQLNQLIAPDTLKNADSLAALRSTVPEELAALFDTAVLNLRSACADVFRLMAVITAVSGLLIVLLTLLLCRRRPQPVPPDPKSAT
ncbi:MAG: MFS transporter [Oscillospiraceae bacterium]|nr:MFS transporter [Oscillospiraceae bacterium]